MRKNQVFTTEMQIEARAEQLHAHRRTLDMPTGAAFTPWARPENVSIFRSARFPERKVGDGLLGVFVVPGAFAGTHFLKIKFQQLSVRAAATAIFLDTEINRAIVRFVCDAAR